MSERAMRKNAAAPMLQSSPCTSPPIDCKIMGAGIDRLPFVACPQNFSITHLSKLVKFSEYDIVKIKENGVVGTVVDIYSTKESFTR